MLPRPSQRSIFHLGEEGGDDHEHDKNIIEPTLNLGVGGRRDHGKQRRKRDAAVGTPGVGLQILIQHRYHHTMRSHIVLKQVVLPTAVAHHRRGPCGGSFLRACARCRRELSPNRDVYMYRGNQGFCSEECRLQQIMTDEAREHDAMIKMERVRRGFVPHHLHQLQHGPRSAFAAIRGAPRRLVAVA